MSISVELRYEQMFKHWHLASEIRFKITATWLTVYAGLFAAFVWFWTTHKPIAFVPPLLGFIATLLFWSMDDRNGGAIRAAQEIITEFENDARIPAAYQVVTRADMREGRLGKILFVRHYIAIAWFTVIMAVLLLAATVYLGLTYTFR